MGVYIIKSKDDKRCLIEETRNLRSGINRLKFMLDFGNHPNSKLQEAWNKEGEKAFQMEVLEILEYSKDESKTDYREELQLLKTMWQEKLKEEGMDLFQD
ncbi:MAG: GIY-YIG nuclease family protein [Bacillota bacterium]